jgi:hypothetical protein
VFGDYEGIRYSKGIPNSITVPSNAARQGILNFLDPSKFPSGCVATSVPNQCQLTVDPSVQKISAVLARFFQQQRRRKYGVFWLHRSTDGHRELLHRPWRL